MTLPVSVVIPHIKAREGFFHEVCLPSVEAARPAQIIVVDREGGSAEKRNEGAAKARQPYLLFLDDDAELIQGALEIALYWLGVDPGAAFAYGDTRFVSHVQPVGEFTKVAVGWNLETLRRSNFIDVTALIRTPKFPGFDMNVKRFQDWDLWLTMASKGERGVYCRRALHRTHRLSSDRISEREDYEKNSEFVKRKHGIS